MLHLASSNSGETGHFFSMGPTEHSANHHHHVSEGEHVVVEYEHLIRKSSKALFKRMKSVNTWIAHSRAVQTNKQTKQPMCFSNMPPYQVCVFALMKTVCVAKNMLANIN